MVRLWIVLTGVAFIALGLRGLATTRPETGRQKLMLYPTLALTIGGGLMLALYGLLA